MPGLKPGWLHTRPVIYPLPSPPFFSLVCRRLFHLFRPIFSGFEGLIPGSGMTPGSAEETYAESRDFNLDWWDERRATPCTISPVCFYLALGQILGFSGVINGKVVRGHKAPVIKAESFAHTKHITSAHCAISLTQIYFTFKFFHLFCAPM